MVQLKCGVTTCSNNEKDCCCRPDIKVTGNQAKYQEETKCSSFVEKDSFITNFVSYTRPNLDTEIYCDAKNCLYNSHSKCTAEEIYMDGSNARTKSQTQCVSFKNAF